MWMTALLGAALALSPDSLDALRQGDCRAALSDPQGPVRDAERLAIARCQLVGGQAAAAISTLEPARRGGLGAYANLLSAEALLATGHPEAAAERLTGLKLNSDEAHQRAEMLRGQAQIESDLFDAGRVTLSALLTGTLAKPGAVPSAGGADPAEVRWWLAEGAVRRGAPEKAVGVWQTIWSHNPTSPRAIDAAGRLAAAGHPVDDLSKGGARDLTRARIKTLEKRHEYALALALRDALAEDGPATMARAAFKAKDYPRAVTLYDGLPAPSAGQRFDAALAASRTGDYAGAARRYSDLIDQFPTDKKADEASYKLGYLPYDAGDLDVAVTRFKEHLERYPTSSFGVETRWFTAWALYRLGRLEDSDAAFAALQSEHGSSSLAIAGTYWRARIADQQGRSADATAGYTRVATRYPLSGYAWFAAERLGWVWTPDAPTAPTPAPDALQQPAWERGRALADVGLTDWAQSELLRLKDTAQKAGRDGIVALGEQLLAAGAYPEARALVKGRCSSNPAKTKDASIRHLCWPRPLNDIPARAAIAGGLDPNLPYAIMNAESALKPWVTSPAGARGLMQLMPELGSELDALSGGVPPFDTDRLYQPGTNARLGVAELVRLQSHLSDAGVAPTLPLVIAGYNGGEEAVRRWLTAYPEPPEADRWAEDIGYTETRRYVRRVLGYVMTYRAAYGSMSKGSTASGSEG